MPFQLLNTAPMPPQSCSIGSSGNGLPRSFATLALNSSASVFRSSAVRSVSEAYFFARFSFVEVFVEELADALALGRLDVFGLLHDHVGVHHDQAAVGVVDEPRVAGLRDQAGDRGGGQTDVQHGFHHAGHRGAGAGAAGEQERIVGVAELHAHDRFGLLQGGGDLVGEFGGEFAPGGEVGGAELGADGEAGGHGKAQGHISARLAPLPPSRFLSLAVPSAEPPPKVYTYLAIPLLLVVVIGS